MGRKSVLVLMILFVFIITSCFERSSYRVSSRNSGHKEYVLSHLFNRTFGNKNNKVRLAFRGKELNTSDLIRRFYERNELRPVWTTENKPNHNSRKLMSLFGKAAYYGLDTSFYQYRTLKDFYYTLKNGSGHNLNSLAFEYELLMTHNCFKMMSHLSTGVLKADTAIYGPQKEKFPKSFSTTLYRFVNESKITEGILGMQPQTDEYKQLQKGLEAFLNSMAFTTENYNLPNSEQDSSVAYARAREIMERNSFFEPAPVGKGNPRYLVKEIADFESNTIGYTYDYSSPQKGDAVFIASLKKFQKAHGLHPDGKLGKYTKNALLMNNRERFEQIAINLERLRWEKTRPARYIYVNLAAYKLRVFNKNMVKKMYDVVVGTPWTKTPLLNSEIEYFITNPKWYVPLSISKNEILPRIKKDPNYLARHGYKVYDTESNPVNNVDWSKVTASNFNLRFQQKPGNGNAMGRIKFYFDSGTNNILIHDTNDKSKFSKDIRAYSHGCIRISNPVNFGVTLVGLEKPNTADSVKMWVDRGQKRRYVFESPIQLYVRYVTCEANSNGNVTFYHDIYGKDEELKQQLFVKKVI